MTSTMLGTKKDAYRNHEVIIIVMMIKITVILELYTFHNVKVFSYSLYHLIFLLNKYLLILLLYYRHCARC